jgi:hypothetical protein
MIDWLSKLLALVAQHETLRQAGATSAEANLAAAAAAIEMAQHAINHPGVTPPPTPPAAG